MNQANKHKNSRIGSIDLETYPTTSGELEVYAGGCALSDGYKKLYYIDHNKSIYSGNALISTMVSELFDYIAAKKKERNGYTLYAHNLGRFDSVFLIKTLSLAGYGINGKWQDNDILCIKITDKTRKLHFNLKDSFKLVPTSLEKLLISFNCNISKGMFPPPYPSLHPYLTPVGMGKG